MAMVIDDVRLALGVEHVSLIGSSYGGFLSLVYAARRPDSITSLVLVDTPASYGSRRQSVETAKRLGTPWMLKALERLWDGSLERDEMFDADWREILPLYFHQLPREEIQQIADYSSYRLEARRQILPSLQDYDIRQHLATIADSRLACDAWHLVACRKRTLSREVSERQRH